MNVCLLGEEGKRHDEGMKNMSMRLNRHLDDYVTNVTLLDLRQVDTVEFWQRARRVEADVVHLIPGPTPQGLALLATFGRLKEAKTVATATQPRYTGVLERLPAPLRPDRLLTQSESARDQFAQVGYSTEFLPSGVDLEKYHSVPGAERRAIRQDLDLPVDERLFLHVGHFKEGRNVLDLLSLQAFGEVVVIGSPSTGPERKIIERLRTQGCHVRTEYIEDIERYYQAVDTYVFPVRSDGHSIQAPLTVFEAMACGCPVVTTDFGGLSDCFDPGNGFRIVDNIADVTLEQLTFEDPTPRDNVRPYSWDSIIEQTASIYRTL